MCVWEWMAVGSVNVDCSCLWCVNGIGWAAGRCCCVVSVFCLTTTVCCVDCDGVRLLWCLVFNCDDDGRWYLQLQCVVAHGLTRAYAAHASAQTTHAIVRTHSAHTLKRKKTIGLNAVICDATGPFLLVCLRRR
jgi:hypothetical protein